MFKLYIDKEKLVLKIEPLGDLMPVNKVGNDVVRFNSNYYVCNNRKKLRDFAEQLKLEWLIEVETRLEAIKNMKIKNKY